MTTPTSIDNIINSSRFTVLLGKNGAGKSSLLRTLDASKRFNARYISPERGGTLKYDAGVDNNIAQSAGWLEDTRRQNRYEQFRQQSAAQFRTLEILILREIEKDSKKRSDNSYTFDLVIEKLNNLLPAIQLIRSDRGFSIQSKTGLLIQEEQISSGESELIALAIEVLVFSRSEQLDKTLLLDEPDVHLHPDLQQQFIKFVESIAVEKNLRVVISTHSTAIIGAFSQHADVSIVPVSKRGQTEFISFRRSKICNEVLPVFGAHPLSNIFNQSPVVLVEGDDDKRVLEQAIRSSSGKLRFSPCVVGSVSELGEWENWLNHFLPVLYDEPRGFSLRDLDDAQQSDLEDLGVVTRVRLNCYAIENLLLTDECFSKHGFTPESFRNGLEKWREHYPDHPFSEEVQKLVEQYDERRTLKVKNLRNIVVALLGNNKPWEVVVGQLIATTLTGASEGKHSIRTYLGAKATSTLFA